MNNMSALAKKLGKRIRELRKKQDSTSEKFAQENGISVGYFCDIENGKRLPTLEMLEKIAKALGVPLRELF